MGDGRGRDSRMEDGGSGSGKIGRRGLAAPTQEELDEGGSGGP